MKETTKTALVAILATDPTISEEQRDAALAALRGAATPPLLPMVKSADAQRLLGVKRTTLWSLAKAGVLTPVKSHGSNRTRGFTRESVEAYLRGAAS